MKVHLKQIPPEGLHLEGREDCPILELEAEGIRCTGPMHYNIEIGVSDGALWASGALNQPLELSCVACLDRFVYEIKVPAFALHTELHGPETVDLTPFMREDILLNLPAHPHCDRDGGRICEAAAALDEPVAQVDVTQGKRQSDWDALDKLKLR
jgi:uncharacterized protein